MCISSVALSLRRLEPDMRFVTNNVQLEYANEKRKSKSGKERAGGQLIKDSRVEGD